MNDQTNKTQDLPSGDRGVESKVCPRILFEISQLLFPSDKKPEQIFDSAIKHMHMAALAAAVLGRTVKVELEFTGSNEMTGSVDEQAIVELVNMEQSEILSKIVPALDEKFTIMHKHMSMSPLAKLLFENLRDAGKQMADDAKEAA